jgi:hypothetical protein
MNINVITGVVFNCGRDCVIEQTSDGISVINALLGSATKPATTVRFSWDGKRRDVVDSNAPGKTLSAAASWQDGTLRIDIPPRFTQQISIEGGQLIVESIFNGPSGGKTVLTYERRR